MSGLAVPPPAAAPGQQPAPSPWPKNWMGISSLALAGASVLLSSLPGVGFMTIIAGIVLGHMGMGAIKHGEANNRSITKAGLITNYVALGLGLLVVVVAIFATAFFIFGNDATIPEG